MNSFANSLFLLLFGGVRTVIQEIWGAVASGRYSGFFTWLGDHWLWLAAFLCLACTVIDFAVWLIRWRPYLVWRTFFRRAGRLFHREKMEDAWRFRRGYQGGVGIEIPQEPEDAPQTDWEEEALREAQKGSPPEIGHTFTQAVAQVNIPLPWQTAQQQAVPADSGAYQDSDPNSDPRQRYFTPPAYEAPPLYVSSRLNAAGADLSVARRRRRSEKYEKRRAEWREKLIKGDEEEDRLLDGLPPAVDRQQAFHEPVYPRQNAFTAWQRPRADEQQTDGQQ